MKALDHTNFASKDAEYVKSFCDKANFTVRILSNKNIRNRIIHIDYYLEKEMRKENTGWMIDSAIDHRGQFNFPDGLDIGFSRTLLVAEQTILHLGYEIFLPDLRLEAANILALVFGAESPPPPSLPEHTPQFPRVQPNQNGA